MKAPKIRFPGFTDDWEQRKLSEIADIVGGGTPSTNNPEYWDGSIDWYAPAEMEGQRYAVGSVKKITELGLQKSSATMLPAGRTVLFTSRAGIGKMAILQRSAATNQGFQSIVLKDGYNPYFIYSMGSKIKELAEGVASGSTFLEISGKMLGNLVIAFPLTTEQDKIASYFQRLDDLITLHQRKLDDIKLVKQSLLQKMFPKNGEDIPEVRFPGFTDAWEQRKLGQVFTQVMNYINPSEENLELWSLTVEDGLTPKTERYTRDFLVKKDDKYKMVAPGVVVYNPMNMTLGAVGYNAMNESVAVSGYYITMILNEGYDINFINTWMKSRQAIMLYKSFATGSLIEKQRVQFPTLSIIPTSFPNYEEQQQIGTFFKNLDDLITLHQRKLDNLKQLKQAMLQQMFI